jgi:predicted DNA-binding protein
MPGVSMRTKPFALRLATEVADKVMRLSKKHGVTPAEYLRRIIERDVMRKR